MIEYDEKPAQLGAIIKVIGVGGAGGNAVNTMIENNLTGVEFVSANTDMSDLVKSKANMKLQLGRKLTRGNGAGANPDLGERSAEEAKDDIKAHLEGADMIFIAAGMGGGTGTGAAPVIAKTARDMGILTLGIVTTPFKFEGERRMSNAEEGVRKLAEYVDTMIVIPNTKICEIYGDLTMLEAFQKADNVLYEAAKAVSDIINVIGLWNVDFYDLRTVMQNMGYALMGTGISDGDNRAVTAANAAINNPLLSDISLHGCQSLLVNVTAGPDIRMNEFEEAVSVISNETGLKANIITGLIVDPNYLGKISVTIIAAGLKGPSDKIVDFPKSAVVKPAPIQVPEPVTYTPPPKTTKPEESVEDIFRILNINQPGNKDDNSVLSDDTPKQVNPRTDVPSFLKALD